MDYPWDGAVHVIKMGLRAYRGESVRKICTFNLDINVVKEMNKEIRRGYRSNYVETAIKEKLKRS